MAYIKTEEVAEIRKRLKEEFGKRFKFSVTRENYSGVNVRIMEMDEGDLDLLADKNLDGYDEERTGYFQEKIKEGYLDINEFYIQEGWNGETRNVLAKVRELCEVGNGSYDRNSGDLGADYPDYTYFIRIGFGKWDKPLKIREAA